MDKVLDSETFKSFIEKWANKKRSPRNIAKKPAPPKKTVAKSSKPAKATSKAKASLTIKLDSLIEPDPVPSRPNPEVRLKHISSKPKPLQKDESGFLMPAPPPSKTEKKLLDCRHLLSMSLKVLSEEEVYYTLDQLTTYCERVFAKAKRGQLNHTKRMQPRGPNLKPVEKWVNEVSRYYNTDDSTPDVQTSREETFHGKSNRRLQTYILKDWTVFKLPRSHHIKLAGVLMSLSDKKVLEDDHVSSNVTERLSERTVLTDKCKYNLVGKYIDPGKSVPKQIKDFFASNTFPENWEAIVKLWNDTEVMKKPAGGPVKRREPSEKNKAPSKSQKNPPKKTERQHRSVSDAEHTLEEGKENETPVIKKRKIMTVEAEICTPRTARNTDEQLSIRTRKASHRISEASSSSQLSYSLRSRSAREESEVSSQANLNKYPVTPIVKKKPLKHLTPFVRGPNMDDSCESESF